MTQPVVTGLVFTGERFVPGAAGEIWYEHWHRYHFALPLVHEARVLDVACGSGYGSALLARNASHVTGVDISAEAIAHARSSYGSTPNLEFREGDCAALPFADASFDVVVSFETIEHITEQERFLDEVRRVLTPRGLLVLSCPNRREYSEARGIVNPFHVRELYREELAQILAPRFASTAWYGQYVSFFSVLAAEEPARQGEIFETSEAAPVEASLGHGRSRYFLVLASADSAALQGTQPRISVLADRDEWVYRDYEKVTRALHEAHSRGNALEQALAQLQRHHDEAVRQRDAVQREHAEAVRQRDALLTEINLLGHELAAAKRWQAKLDADIVTLNRELRHREGWRWWWRSLLRLVAGVFTRSPVHCGKAPVRRR
jgi:ubiquinone/menaquinone biosynthesis C-methylase UbiE